MEPQKAEGTENLMVADVSDKTDAKPEKKAATKTPEPAPVEGEVHDMASETEEPELDPTSSVFDEPSGPSIMNVLGPDSPDFCLPEPKPAP